MGFSTAPATSVSTEISARVLTVSALLWREFMEELQHRGHGVRESGGFLLGTRTLQRERARRFVCYDELDPHALDTGIIRFASDGYSKLWDLCRRWDLRVVGDVHTHPGAWVSQSPSDQEYPMLPESGHLAFIVPYFARCTRWGFAGVGVHEYLAKGEWRSWDGPERSGRVRITWW